MTSKQDVDSWAFAFSMWWDKRQYTSDYPVTCQVLYKEVQN